MAKAKCTFLGFTQDVAQECKKKTLILYWFLQVKTKNDKFYKNLNPKLPNYILSQYAARSAGKKKLVWHIDDKVPNKSDYPNYIKVGDFLLADTTGVETSGVAYDFLSNGIKFRAGSQNEDGETYTYIAFAEQPTKFANAR